MTSPKGKPRRDAIIALCPKDRLVIDVGADHGYVASALGGVATERQPHRIRHPEVGRWVVADGLAPFHQVPVAVIAGMGAKTISGILNRGPRPDIAILHAQDDPPALRRYLAGAGWAIDAESLAPEAGRFAEIIRAVPGVETARGLTLELGPKLLVSDSPHLMAHVLQLLRRWRHIAKQTEHVAPKRWALAVAHTRFLREHLHQRGWTSD